MTRKNKGKESKKDDSKRNTLILVCGLPGTGKSTVSKAIAERTKALLFNTDVVRKELFSRPAYTQEEKDLVYKMLFEMAEKFLKQSKNIVLDGTFYKEELRSRVKEIAQRNRSAFAIVEVVCSEKTAKRRLDERAKSESLSDADFCVYRKIREQFEPIREKHFVVDTGKNVGRQIAGFLKNF
jgi:predicted kinase